MLNLGMVGRGVFEAKVYCAGEDTEAKMVKIIFAIVLLAGVNFCFVG